MTSTITGAGRVAALLAGAALALSLMPSAQAVSPSRVASHQHASQAGLTVGAATPYCGIWWGSLDKATTAGYTSGTVENVRAGRHTCFDRMVIDVEDVPGSLGYQVRYVDAVRQDGSGQVVPLRGGATLQVVLRAPAYDEDGGSTLNPPKRSELVDVTGWSTFRQVAWAGSFEGQSTIGLGVRARLPYRVFVLDGPGDGARLVIDVAHRW